MKKKFRVVALSVLLSGSAVAQSTDLPTSVSPPSIAFSGESPVCVGTKTAQEACLTLGGSAAVDKVDVFFLFDDTGSFASFVPTVRTIFGQLAVDLEGALPGIEFGFGVGRFEDFGGTANSDFSNEDAGGRPFTLNQPILTKATAGGATQRDTLINEALNRTAAGYGGDGPETALEALYQVAVGAGLDGNGDGGTSGLGGAQPAGSLGVQTASDDSGDVPAFSSLEGSVLRSGTVGGAGFRTNALKLVVLATDICTVAPFPAGAPIPTDVSGNGITVPATDFACSSGVAGSSRFGFVSNAKDLAGNTVTGAVAPSGSATVQQVIDALTAGGIRVIGMGPTATVKPIGSGPTFDPSTLLSSLARLTKGVDKDGNPLVFSIGGGGTVLREKIVQAVLAAAKAPIDVSLRVGDGASSELSVGITPPVVSGVLPGSRACFSVEFAGSGAEFASGFPLNFVDVTTSAASTAVLGSVPVTADCGLTLGCTDVNLTDVVSALDGSGARQRSYVVKAAERLRRLGGRNSTVASIVAKADGLYEQNWMLANTLPLKTKTCTNTALCSSTSTGSITGQYEANATEFHRLLKSTLNKVKSKRRGKVTSSDRNLLKAGEKVLKSARAESAKVPSSVSSCSEPVTSGPVSSDS